ncbi:hypothetical protein O181_006993 [Austropuccinia psidii MF-1]|uniref:Uncharacterized protein n=1 Tax=Austropuccinia psidii MF-1 TaxID=1389203 RepID=A0A9Q3BLJ1_9BASI|nr:hypothetical protein [Austropuccinia psidii MF-1]
MNISLFVIAIAIALVMETKGISVYRPTAGARQILSHSNSEIPVHKRNIVSPYVEAAVLDPKMKTTKPDVRNQLRKRTLHNGRPVNRIPNFVPPRSIFSEA